MFSFYAYCLQVSFQSTNMNSFYLHALLCNLGNEWDLILVVYSISLDIHYSKFFTLSLWGIQSFKLFLHKFTNHSSSSFNILYILLIKFHVLPRTSKPKVTNLDFFSYYQIHYLCFGKFSSKIREEIMCF